MFPHACSPQPNQTTELMWLTVADPDQNHSTAAKYPPYHHFFQPLSVIVGLHPSSLMSTGWVAPLRGDWAIFCHAGSGRVGRVWSARKNSLEILRRGWELNPGHREDSELLHWVIMTIIRVVGFYSIGWLTPTTQDHPFNLVPRCLTLDQLVLC